MRCFILIACLCSVAIGKVIFREVNIGDTDEQDSAEEHFADDEQNIAEVDDAIESCSPDDLAAYKVEDCELAKMDGSCETSKQWRNICKKACGICVDSKQPCGDRISGSSWTGGSGRWACEDANKRCVDMTICVCKKGYADVNNDGKFEKSSVCKDHFSKVECTKERERGLCENDKERATFYCKETCGFCDEDVQKNDVRR